MNGRIANVLSVFIVTVLLFCFSSVFAQYTPDLTGSGTPSASHEDNESSAAMVFDDNISTYVHMFNSGSDLWVKYDFGVGQEKLIVKYTLTPNYQVNFIPVDWVFQGSNNDADWTDLHTINGAALSGETKYEYPFSNSTFYRFYRINITATTMNYYCAVAELEMMAPAPTVDTPTSADITETTATLGGNIADLGGSNVTERGIYWSTSDGFTPPGQGTKVSETGDWSSTGVFTIAVTGLPSGTMIYFRAFATNNTGTGYSSQQYYKPDLTVSKVNNVSDSLHLGGNWTWTLTVSNGNIDAVFTDGDTLLIDNLPDSDISYGTPAAGNFTGVTNSGNIACAIDGSRDLAVTASGADVTLVAGSSFDITFTATPSDTGVFINPRLGGICSVDPSELITEANEGNNAGTDTVTVIAPDLKVFKSNNMVQIVKPLKMRSIVTKQLNGPGTILLGDSWIWKLWVYNGGDGIAKFTDGQVILTDQLPNNNIGYGSVSIENVYNITNSGNINAVIVGNLLTITASGAEVIIDNGGSFFVSFTCTPTAIGTFINPVTGSSCTVDPNAVVIESNESNNTSNSDTVFVKAPDLRVTKTNNKFNSVKVGEDWVWNLSLGNSGDTTATFTDGQVILIDNLPNTNITYTGLSGVLNPVNITNAVNIDVTLAGYTVTVSASGGPVTFGSDSSCFDIQFTATNTVAGDYNNPRSGGICMIDPNNLFVESDEANNSTTNNVSVNSANIDVSPASLDFGTVETGTENSLSTAVRNRGVGPLEVSSTVITGANSDAFSILYNEGPFTVDEAGRKTMHIGFSPESPGKKRATLEIHSNSLGEELRIVELSGTAIAEGHDSPQLVYFYPADSAASVPLNTDIQWKIEEADDGPELDLNSIQVRLVTLPVLDTAPNDTTDIAYGQPSDKGEVTFTVSGKECAFHYQPDSLYAEGDTVLVEVTCSDVATPPAVLNREFSFIVGTSSLTYTNTDTLDQFGGSFFDDSSGISITIPANALGDTTTITINKVDNLPPLPDSLNSIGLDIYLGPAGLQFAEPVVVSLPFTPEDLTAAGVTDPLDLSIYYYSMRLGGWIKLDIVSADTTHVYVSVTEFCYFILGQIDASTTGVLGDDPLVIVERIELRQNYPNPFNPSTVMEFVLPVQAHVTLTVYNVLGQMVDILVDHVVEQGAHTVHWDASGVEQGIYFYRIQTEGYTEVRKCTLLK